jgi:hypothetical protein
MPQTPEQHAVLCVSTVLQSHPSRKAEAHRRNTLRKLPAWKTVTICLACDSSLAIEGILSWSRSARLPTSGKQGTQEQPLNSTNLFSSLFVAGITFVVSDVKIATLWCGTWSPQG